MNNAPEFSAQQASSDQDELADRRRPGRPKHVNPHLIPLLRDPSGGQTGPAEALDEATREYYLAREERFRTALGRGASQSNVKQPFVARMGSASMSAMFAIAGRFIPEFRERRPEEAYHDDKYIGHY
jgi:hypothetical protein